MKEVLVIHGGAGVIPKTFPPEKIEGYRNGLLIALEKGFSVLKSGGSALDGVMEAVLEFERNPLFNAGKGAVYTAEETHEMDAAIMDGLTMNFGAACTVHHIKHPIRLARRIMEKSPHRLLSGEGAESFARIEGLEFVDNAYFDDAYRYEQLKAARKTGTVARDHDIQTGPWAMDQALEPVKPMGTVGAVALDAEGNLAAATSTGGTTNKACGRVGDTPIPGAGTYANNSSCAVSCTGFGEEFMVKVAAYDVHARMIYQGLSLEEAANSVVHGHLQPGSGGLIALDRHGNFALPFNTDGMFRAYKKSDSEPYVSIWE